MLEWRTSCQKLNFNPLVDSFFSQMGMRVAILKIIHIVFVNINFGKLVDASRALSPDLSSTTTISGLGLGGRWGHVHGGVEGTGHATVQ